MDPIKRYALCVEWTARGRSVSVVYTETRADGWPICPCCGEDELWSGFTWDGLTDRPPMQAWIDHGLRCYKCGWDSESLIVSSVVSAIAAMMIQRQHDAGKDITIPSLGIVIPGKNQ
jgi:hypothetical protein